MGTTCQFKLTIKIRVTKSKKQKSEVKQKIQYKINQDAFDVEPRFEENTNERETQNIIKKILESKTDFSIISTEQKNNMIKHFDRLLHVALIQQNLATLIIHDLYGGDKTVRKKAENSKKSSDESIRLILKLIKKINPNIGKLYAPFIFHSLSAKQPKTILDTALISKMEKLGKKN